MKETFDFIQAKKFSFPISGILIVIGIALLFLNISQTNNAFRYGSDFQGGIQLQVHVGQGATIAEVKDALNEVNANITAVGESGQEFLIKLIVVNDLGAEGINTLAEKKLIVPLKTKYNRMEIKNKTTYDPTQGSLIKEQALEVSLLILVLILFYIGLRFEFKFGVAAIVALLHDVLIVMTLVLLFNREMDIPTVVALLTIMGYSLNDTIVVFDRIRENRDLLTTDDHTLVVNKSIYQSLSRTVVTSLTTLFVVGCIFVLGGPALENLSFALLIGIFAGTYSSIFVASPILVIWENIQHKSDKRKGIDSKKGAPKKKKKSDDKVMV